MDARAELREWYDRVRKSPYPKSFESETEDEVYFDLYYVEAYLAGVAHRILHGQSVPTDFKLAIKTIELKDGSLHAHITIPLGDSKLLNEYASTLLQYAQFILKALES